MDAEQKDTARFFLKSWLEEAVRRCDSFLHSANKPFSLDDDFHKRRMFEEHYALTATVMGVRFAKQLVHHAPRELKERLESFIAATQDAVDIRDMREHSDEYFLGKGRKKEEFFKGSGQGVQCDMSSSIKDENGYMLGNLVAMETVRDECQALHQYIHDDA